jgi:hypothetical protein
MDKIRDVLSSILESAVRYELLVKNPVEGVRLAKPSPRLRWVEGQAFESLYYPVTVPCFAEADL